MRTARRMELLGSEGAFAVADRVRDLTEAGREVVSLHIGEPDFDTPPNVVEAAYRALADGHTHYPPPLGMAAFREAIAADFGRRRGVEIPPGRVVVTPGAKPIVAFTLMATVEPGDEVIVPDPGFPIYASMARFLGLVPVALPLRAENDFRLDLDELRSLITSRSRLLVVNSPHNPTGATLALADLEGLASIAMAHDLTVLADEVYSRLLYTGEHRSLLEIEGMAERTVVLDGLSKTYAMTGWRLGWGIVPWSLVEPFERLIVNTVSGTAAYAQLAGVEALAGPQFAADRMLAEFRARRSLVLDGLRSLPGLDVPTPSGAFYVFPDVSGSGLAGAAFAERLLTEAGVSVLAGTDFGAVAVDHVRISYANSRANLRLALERIAAFLDACAG